MGNTCKSQNCCSTETQKEFQANEAVTSANSQGTQDLQNQRNSSIRQQNQEPKSSIDANLAKEQNQEIVKHIREASVSSQRDKQDEQQRVEQLKTLVGKVSNLKLKVISSTNLKKGKVFIINPLQAEESTRKNIDGYTYIGCKKYLKPKREDPKQFVINDIIIPAKETNEKHRGRHFYI